MKRGHLIFVGAFALSGALHAAGAIAVIPRDDLAIEGGATSTVALLGEAFEDLAIGAQPVVATEAQPLTAPPVTTETAVATPVTAASPASPVLLPSAETPDLAAQPAVEPSAPVEPNPASQVAATEATAPATPPLAHIVEADPAPPETSPRSHKRPEKKRTAESGRSAPAGNADRNARKGAQGGQEAAQATAAAAATPNTTAAREAGNAARSSYPGTVLRKIERTRKPATSARGTVVVSFRVAPSGALASARVARSTGDPSLERAALDHIRRAAPFPPPPTGADTNFRFEFVGRR